jgi:hypothetical protein
MNKLSVVVDHQTISYWKYEIILTLYKKGLLETIYITDKSSKDFRLALKRIVCTSLSRITISEYFSSIKRISLKTGAKPTGDLVWLSESLIDFEYVDNIFYFCNEIKEQKFESSLFLRENLKFKSITYFARKNKNKVVIVNGCWTEEAKFSDNKTISNNLASLQFLVDGRNNDDQFENFKTNKASSIDNKSSRISSILQKLYFLLFYYTSWSIYTYPMVINVFNKNILEDSRLKNLFNDKSWNFKADPFYLESENSLFIEKFNYLLGRGKLAKYSFDSKDLVNIQTNSSLHFSYPCLFEYDKNNYVIPEAAQSNGIIIYKKNEDNSITPVTTVVDNFAGIDPTIFEHNGMWYIFATDGSFGSNSFLNIFYAEDPLSNWSQHELNPVKVNTQNSRGGGEIFKEGDSIIRPTQNCYPSYGTSLLFNKIETLSPMEFKEKIIGEVKTSGESPYKGIHTFSRNKNSFIVDLKTNEFFPFARLVTLLRARLKSNDDGMFLENSLFKRLAVVFLFFVFVVLVYIFGWRALSLFV